MSDLKPDEKVCPFCAETIKKAAVVCRHCNRDLPPASAAQPRASAATPAAGVIEETPRRAPRWQRRSQNADLGDKVSLSKDVAQPKASDSGPDDETTSSRLAWPVLVVLLLAGLLAVFFAIDRANSEETAADGTITSTSARAVAMQRVADSTATILSYQAETFDADAEKAGKLMTESMREDYLKALEPVKADVVKQGITLKATVVATSLTSITDDTVRALLFVNQSTTAEGASNEQLDNNRVLVTMKRHDGDWLISKMDPF